jgi:indolepyruvate ferredoxin oxidoreductase, beta subunit
MKYSLVLTGVGGQGTILASRAISLAAMEKGYTFRSTETLGMAQRGGSVISHIRFGDNIYSPLIPAGQADALLGFELAEAVRWVSLLKKGGVALVNADFVPPYDVLIGESNFDEGEAKKFLKSLEAETVIFDMTALAIEAGSFRATNAVLLGAFSVKGGSPLEAELLEKVMLDLIPKKLTDINRKAFELGREACLKGAAS